MGPAQDASLMETLVMQLLALVVGVLLLVSAMLSGAVRQALDRLMRRPLESLIVVIALNEAANICAECLGTSLLLVWIGPLGAYVSVPLMFILVLLIADITPK